MIAFAYFHSLSRPFIEPPLDQITSNPPIEVEGETVLRFGLMEGDAIVQAQRAVYDPQTSRSPAKFQGNGSQARELAIVLNEDELFAFTGERNQVRAASKLMREQHACLAVVKQGALGATVYGPKGQATKIPAFRTERVFKIGSGDIFSAGFAIFWGEKKLPAEEAASLASQLAAAYCSNPVFPMNATFDKVLQPARGALSKPIFLLGKTATMGQRYVMEEARYHLEALGADVICPVLAPARLGCSDCASTLLVSDGYSLDELKSLIVSLGQAQVIVLDELGRMEVAAEKLETSYTLCNDFSSALYQVIWASLSQ